MQQTESIVKNKFSNNPYLFINLIFAFFPISFIAGGLFINLNILLFCLVGIFYIKSNYIKIKFNLPTKIIFIFFLLIVLSTSINFIITFYYDGFSNLNTVPLCFSTNCFSPLIKLIKSILFFRFFLLLLIIYLLNKEDILNFKYFILSASLASVIISLDIIYQFIFGHNIIGLKSAGYSNSGFFGNEYIAGSFIQRFSFFAILFTILIFRDKKYTKFISTIVVMFVLSAGIILSGNKMPVILFIFGLFFFLFFNLQIKKMFFTILLTLMMLFSFIILSNEKYKSYIHNTYKSFYGQANTMLNKTGLQKWVKTKRVEENQTAKSKTNFYTVKHESNHRRIYLAAIDTWKINSIFSKIFGNGIKSFREDCWKLEDQPNTYLGEDLYPGMKNRLCSNHPHNYYLEILVEAGILGLLLIFTIGLIFIVFIFKNLRSIKKTSVENIVLLSAIASLFIETFPFKSTGSLFTTSNATYLILISSIFHLLPK
jgi:hypothetical protein